MTVTRFPNGVGNSSEDGAMGALPLLDPSKEHTYFDDFDVYRAADWTVTEVGVATQVLADADGGRLLITNAGADDNSSFSNKVGEGFLFELGVELWFKCRFSVNDALQSDVVIGLQITDTTPLAVSDGVYFIKNDAAATVDFVVNKDTTLTTVAAVATLVDDVDIELAFHWDGVEFTIFVDDEEVGTAVATNLPDDELLTISYGIQNGEAAIKTMSIDYISVVKPR